MNLFLTLIFVFFSGTSYAQDILPLKAAMHINSKVSEGKYSLEDIARACSEKGFDVVIFTDRDFMRWEWGVLPLRNLIKKKVEHNSIFTYGVKRYLDQIERLNQSFSGMVFIPGCESSPFYYWAGSLFEGNLIMKCWHRHILAVGLNKPQDYLNLPTVANSQGLRRGFDLYKSWPILVIVFGLVILVSFKKASGKKNILAILLAGIGFLFFLNNWPFLKILYDQYHGDQGIMPYQNFIDYVDSKGGLSYWVHPDEENISSNSRIKFETLEYSQYLKETKGYTGFSIFYGGEISGDPEGLWDKILLEYCNALRDKPVWAIGGLAFESASLEDELKSLQTIIMAGERSEQSVIRALREGKAYVKRGKQSPNFNLEKFYLCDKTGITKGLIGDEVRIDGRVLIHIEAGFSQEQQEVEVKIIKNGKVAKVSKIQAPFLISYYDDNNSGKKSYYRLIIKGKDLEVVTNPIFVQRQTKDTRLKTQD